MNTNPGLLKRLLENQVSYMEKDKPEEAKTDFKSDKWKQTVDIFTQPLISPTVRDDILFLIEELKIALEHRELDKIERTNRLLNIMITTQVAYEKQSRSSD